MIRITAGAYFLGAVMILLLPISWLLAVALAALFHELGHIAAIRFLQGRIFGIDISVSGAKIRTGHLGMGEEILCAAAGPVCSLALLSVCNVYPELSICGAIQGVFNLIPMYPSDGGRILRNTLQLLLPAWGGRIFRITEYILFLAALIFLLKAGVSGRKDALVCILILVLRSIPGKIPCKSAYFAVQ